MDVLIWIGAAISLGGVVGLLVCVVLALRARRAGLPDDELRTRLRHVVALNMAALCVSAIGLICVVVGVMLS